PGQASSEADSFLWNQGNFYPEANCGVPCGLHGLWKTEWNHTFNSNFFITTKYAYYGWGYGFDPRGGENQDGGIDVFNDAAYGSWVTVPGRQSGAHGSGRRQLLQNRAGRPARFQFRLHLPPQPQQDHDHLERLADRRQPARGGRLRCRQGLPPAQRGVPRRE